MFSAMQPLAAIAATLVARQALATPETAREWLAGLAKGTLKEGFLADVVVPRDDHALNGFKARFDQCPLAVVQLQLGIDKRSAPRRQLSVEWSTQNLRQF